MDVVTEKSGDSRRICVPKDPSEKYKPISIRLHPKVVEWARAEAERRGIGYQSVINETLLGHVGS